MTNKTKEIVRLEENLELSEIEIQRLNSENKVLFEKCHQAEKKYETLLESAVTLHQRQTEIYDDLCLNWLERMTSHMNATESLILLYNKSRFNPELQKLFVDVLMDRTDANRDLFSLELNKCIMKKFSLHTQLS